MQLGDIVIYVELVNGKADKAAAIVTKVHAGDILNLAVFFDRSTSIFSVQQVVYKNYVPKISDGLMTYWEPKS